MTDSTAVEKTAPASVPALVSTPALEITADDIALPRLYIGQYMSDAVKDKDVPVNAGDVFLGTSADDPSPEVLYTGEGDGVLFHILGMYKTKSLTVSGELVTFNTPQEIADAPPEAWDVYNYTVALPDVDADVPAKFLLTRSGRPAAQKINLVLKKNVPAPHWEQAFRLTTKRRENQKGEYFVAQIATTEAKAEHVKIAEELAVMVSGQAAGFQAASEEPAI